MAIVGWFLGAPQAKENFPPFLPKKEGFYYRVRVVNEFAIVLSTPFSMFCGEKQQPCQNDVLETRPHESRPKATSYQRLVPSLFVKFERYTFLTRQVELVDWLAAVVGKKTT